MEVQETAFYSDFHEASQIVDANDTIAPVICDGQYDPTLGIVLVGFGSLISLIGVVANFTLLYMFLTRGAYRSYPFQTFLALLDFNLCALYIFCFGFPKIAINLRIEWLYIMVRTVTVHTLFLSRIIQLLIPYILIANTADKFIMMSSGINTDSEICWNKRIIVITTLFWIAVVIRVPTYMTYFVKDEPECDLFESKVLMTIDSEYQEFLLNFDFVVQFFHTFVSFIILCFLNTIVIKKQRDSHKRARRQSNFPAVKISVVLSNHRDVVHEIARNEEKKLRSTVRTTIVIISSYLACNAANFLIYVVETFRKEWIMNEDYDFILAYYVSTDICTWLFVLSSTIRIFIFYKYNPDLRSKLRTIALVRFLTNYNWKKAAACSSAGLSNYPYTLTSTVEK